jgi:hypothetical protein
VAGTGTITSGRTGSSLEGTGRTGRLRGTAGTGCKVTRTCSDTPGRTGESLERAGRTRRLAGVADSGREIARIGLITRLLCGKRLILAGRTRQAGAGAVEELAGHAIADYIGPGVGLAGDHE